MTNIKSNKSSVISDNSNSSSSSSCSSDNSMNLLATLGEYRYCLNEFEEAKKRLDAFVSEHRELRRYFTHDVAAQNKDTATKTENSAQRPRNFVYALHSIVNNNANFDCICWFTTVDGRDAFTVKSWSRLIKLFNSAGFKVGQELSIRKNLADYRFEKLNDRRKKIVVEEVDSSEFSDFNSDDSKESLTDMAGDLFYHRYFRPRNAKLRLVVRRSPQKNANNQGAAKSVKAARSAASCSMVGTPSSGTKRRREKENNNDNKDSIKDAANKRRKTYP